jgi:hypothetical protein
LPSPVALLCRYVLVVPVGTRDAESSALLTSGSILRNVWTGGAAIAPEEPWGTFATFSWRLETAEGLAFLFGDLSEGHAFVARALPAVRSVDAGALRL